MHSSNSIRTAIAAGPWPTAVSLLILCAAITSAHAGRSFNDDGNRLIADQSNNRIVDVNFRDDIVWSHATNTQPGSNANPLPTRAIRPRNSDTIISDQFNHRVITVSPAGQIVKQYGTLNAPGYDTRSARKFLNAPYDAKVIGDDTGLTWSDTPHIVPQK